MSLPAEFQRHLDACFQQAPQWMAHLIRDLREAVRQTRAPAVQAAGPTVAAALAEALERLHPLLASSFLERLRGKVMQEVQPDAIRGPRSEPGPEAAHPDLHLVDEDQAAEEIEVIRLVQAADDAAEWPLRELQALCATLRGQSAVSRDANPLRPEIVGRALWEAAQELRLGPRERTLLMRLATSVLARELKLAYEDMLRRLREWQVRPAAYRATPMREASAHRQAAPPSTGFDLTQPGKFEELMRKAVPGSRADMGLEAAAGSMDRLEALLRQLLASAPADRSPGDGPPRSPAGASLLRQHEADLHRSARHQADRHAISMLAHLFDKILCDGMLSAPVARTLARLQLPLLRCALVDARLLDEHTHPGWQLLNRLASHLLGYEHERDPRLLGFLDEVEPVLHALERQPQPDAEGLGEALRRVEAVITAQLRAEQEAIGPVIARRRREEERAELQVRQRQRIADRLTELSAGPLGAAVTALPVWLMQFLNGTWARVLAAAVLLHGEEAGPTSAYLATVDDLVRSIQPLHAPEDRSWLLRAVPPLLERLRQGMGLIDLPQADREAFLAELMAMHTGNLKAGLRRGPVEVHAQPDAQARVALPDDPTWPVVRLGDTVFDTASLETVPAALLDEPRSTQAPDAAAWLAALQPGTWCRIFVATRLTPLRLLWVSPVRQSWIFSSGAWSGEGSPRVYALTQRALQTLYAAHLAHDLEGPGTLERAADALFAEHGGSPAADDRPPDLTEGLLRLDLD